MKKSTVRLICIIAVAAFAAVFLISIVMSVALADEESGSRGETVYVSANADGTPREIVSSVYLTNPGGLSEVTDYTTLTAIKNITGNEAPEIDGERATFKAEGGDVCYQGTASGELPFSVSIRYFLDGSEISADEAAGASGKLRIEIDTANNLENLTDVDGEKLTLYTPFSVICMMNLDECASNVTVTGAKLSSQAGRMTILGVLLPGMKENLDIDDTDRISDSFTVEADVKDFSIGSIMFIGMTGIVDENDLSGIDDVESLTSALDELSDASIDMYSASRTMYKGMNEYNDGAGKYIDGVGQAADGAQEASTGTDELKKGAEEFAAGAGELAKGVEQLNEAAKSAQEEFAKLTDPDAELDPATKEMLKATIEEAVRANADDIERSMRDIIIAELVSRGNSETVAEEIADAIMADVDLSDYEVQITDEQLKNMQKALLSTELIYGLSAYVDSLADGTSELAYGADALAQGATKLTEGISELAKGLKELAEGLAELKKNGVELEDAGAAIAKGIGTMSRGLKAMSEDGLQKIVDETDKIDISLSRKDALLALSDGYTSFSGTRSSIGDSVQFILTTDAIEYEAPILEAPSTPEPEETIEADAEARGFFESIGDFFASLWDTVKGWFK